MNAKNDAAGEIRIRVFSADGAFPIENAVVLISPNSLNGENNGVIMSLRTDKSGLTETVYLPTKPRELSESPGNGEPYESYNIETKKEGYYPVNNMNVPIFDGIGSTLPVNLVPLALGAYPSSIGFEENRVYNDITTGKNLN